MRPAQTDLPFKVSETAIVIVKGLPVLQCQRCGEYLLEDSVERWVEDVLRSTDTQTELVIVRYPI